MSKITQIKKRDGRIVDFNPKKIEKAIEKALIASKQGDGKISKELTKEVINLLQERFKDEIPSVENIQDIVEEVLILKDYAKAAKAYILYREQHRRIREIKKSNERAVEMVDQYLQELDWEVRENSNMAYSLQGLNNYVTSAVIKNYWLGKIYPPEIREANESGDFHIHDLQVLGPYCVGWDLYDILLRGFGGVFGKIESKPAKHLSAALGQIVNFFYTLQGEAAGAVALSSFDTLLSPFVYYDHLSYTQIKQEIQEFLFNCNVPTRVGFQTPFTNLTLDLKVPEHYKNQPVLVGGKIQDKTYGEFQEEMNMINKALAETMMEGDAKGRPFTFPIPTYNITNDFDWGNPVYEPIWQMTAKYGLPYYSNFINSDMKPEDVRSMCIEENEEILIRNSKHIKRASIKKIAENYKENDFDREGWAECKKEGNLEALSLNPKTLKLEWSPVKRFLKTTDESGAEIITEDGKKAIFSLKHPMAIYTPEGIKMKFAKDIKKEDYLMVLKKANADVFPKEYQKIENLTLNEDLSKILGYFTADGNYLFENRKGYTHYGEPRGMQFTFKTGDSENLNLIKTLIKKVLNLNVKEKQDPRYNTYYFYLYNTEIARKLYKAGFRKYGRLPQILFNSPQSVIRNFLDFYFKGDGYEKRKEIHLNDLELSRDLVLLFSLIGQPVTYKLRKRSQRIYLQHAKSKIKKGNGWINNPILAERIPGWMTASTKKVPGLSKSRMVRFDTLAKYDAHSSESLKIKNSDIYLTRVKEIKIKRYKQLKEFYDVELEKNHLFVHSLGQVSFNCCRLRLSNKELYKRGGGLFGSNPLTGSLGVVTLNLPRIGYLSKTKREFFDRLAEKMDLAKESLEIKRKTLENLTEKGLYPYSRHYLDGIKKMRSRYWANHFSTIGLVGMNEALLNFKQTKTNIGTKAGQEFAAEVLDFMRERMVKYQEEDGGLYNLEATPAEGSLDPTEKILISQSDPRLTEIGPLIDKYLENNKENIQFIGNSEVLKISEGEMFTYGFNRENQKVKKYPVTALVRHLAHSMYEITTVSGRKVKVTGQHSVFTLNSEGKPEEILVKNLKEKDLIAIPKKIEMEEVNQELNLIEIFKKFSFKEKLYIVFPSRFIENLVLNSAVREWALKNYNFQWKDVKCSWKKNNIVPLKLIYDLDLCIERDILKSSKIFYRDTKNTKPINALISLDRDFGFVLGCLLAEGWLSKRSEFTNTDKNLVQKFILTTEKVFGDKIAAFSSLEREKDKRKTRYTAILSKMTGYFFEAIGLQGKSNTKKVPAFIFFSSKDCVAGLLEGFHCGDGYIYQNKEKNDFSVRLYTNSKELAEGLNLCLLKLGILAKVRKDKKSKYNSSWKDNYLLSITGSDNLKKYFKLVLKKEINLENLHSGRETISEVPKLIKSVMEKYSIAPSQLGISKDSFNRNIRNNKISLQFFKKIIDKLSTLATDKIINQLQVLANSNLYWDKIIKIRKIATPRYVYDLEVDVPGDLVNNFLGGEGLVCLHNTSYRLALKDIKKYPDIITAGNKENPFYTNSSQLPVNFTDDLFEALKLQDNLQTKYTGGCIEKGNKILTDKGLLPIEYIVENFNKLKPIRVVSYNKEKNISEWDKIAKAVVINVKKHDKIRIKGERNLDIVTSDWHPFFVLEKIKVNPTCPVCKEKVGNIRSFAAHLRYNLECKDTYNKLPKYKVVEKRADELKKGDYILQNSCNLYSEKETQLNNDLMWLVGFFIGDGCISKYVDARGGNDLEKYKIRFNSSSQVALEKISKILSKYFGARVRVIQNDKRSKLLREVATSKKEVLDFFFKYGFKTGKKVYNVNIPSEVKKNINKNNVFSLISGLIDSDGHIDKRDGSLEYYTVSSLLADDVLEIFSLAGIMVSKSLRISKRKNEKNLWRLRIPAYEVTKIKENLENTVNLQNIKKDLSNRNKRYLPIIRVKKISKVNVKDNQFYDLMTEKNHNYLAGKNSLVFIHNTVFHSFLGEQISDPNQVPRLIKKVFENFRLPYFTLTPTFSICPVHGYISGEHFTCPKCVIEQPCEVYSRIVGYLRPVQQWNEGKKEEFKERKKFKI